MDPNTPKFIAAFFGAGMFTAGIAYIFFAVSKPKSGKPRWRSFVVATVISLLLGLGLAPTDSGFRQHFRIFIPAFAIITVIAYFAKTRDFGQTYRYSILALVASPFWSDAVMMIVWR